jgi:hypothetical protein
MTITEQQIHARVKRDLISLVVFLLALGLWLAIWPATDHFSRTTPPSVRVGMVALGVMLPTMLAFWLSFRLHEYGLGLRTVVLGIGLSFVGFASFPSAVAHREWFLVAKYAVSMVAGPLIIFLQVRRRHRLLKEQGRSEQVIAVAETTSLTCGR